LRRAWPDDTTGISVSLITGPAERWDLLVDFSKFNGNKVILYNDAPRRSQAPTPQRLLSRRSGNPTQPTPGFGPNTRQIMPFNVVPATSNDAPLRITGNTDLSPDLTPFLVPAGTAVQGGVLTPPPGVPVRQLTLNETFDGYGRLIQLLGNKPAGERRLRVGL
jgi:hypothetical protein